jgi:hypothetical protein
MIADLQAYAAGNPEELGTTVMAALQQLVAESLG